MINSHEVEKYFNTRYVIGIDDEFMRDEKEIHHECWRELKRLHTHRSSIIRISGDNVYVSLGEGEHISVAVTTSLVHPMSTQGFIYEWTIVNGRYMDRHSMKDELRSNKLFSCPVNSVSPNALLRILKSL